ncbi:metallopeptidase family protein [Limibaculum sp. M0105]|uniref:Metallopeptidase family protein n=1 Tax=Thermohalobaculum xanthum TaxID=2753746 RepID=A0A8J7M3P5_9RHOB|nr:metallopeptidase family protein [Thermohalobaculum xanthum]MBK0397761.1 metallopeptidase family protein [Thermohalobaculum xanthum]
MNDPLTDLVAPSLADIDRLARDALEAMPDGFREQCEGVVLRVEDLADDETLAAMGIADPFELTGLYSGVALTEKSFSDLPGGPDEVVLYRRAILDEWAERGDVALGALVAHILVHEIGHHFGLSDEDIARIDPWWE